MRHAIVRFLGLGSTLVFTGAASAQCVEGCLAIHTLTGEAGGDQFGWISNDVGDLDGDGVTDMVIGAPGNDAGAATGGRAYVYSGATGTLLFPALTGALAGGRLGASAGGAGDVDGDLVPDVIVGAPDNGAGRAILYSGADGSVIHEFLGEVAGDRFGFAVNGAGRFDDDATPDVVIGAPNHDTAGTSAGRVYVYSGADFSLICAVDGPSSFDLLGSAVDTIGDVNADGRDEIVMGAQSAGTGGGLGFVYGHDGASCVQRYVLDPGVPSVNFGLFFIDGSRDVNDDGTPDIFVSDFSANRGHVFSGVDGSSIHSVPGVSGFGIGRLVEDANGDGHADMIIAAWQNGEGAPGAGKAFIYSGADATILETFTHNVAGANFGFDANGMGDVNDDGKADYLITAATALGNTGRVYLIAGTIAPPSPDIDDDGMVGTSDLLILLAEWGVCGDCADCPADLDADCIVGTSDLLILLAAWGVL